MLLDISSGTSLLPVDRQGGGEGMQEGVGGGMQEEVGGGMQEAVAI